MGAVGINTESLDGRYDASLIGHPQGLYAADDREHYRSVHDNRRGDLHDNSHPGDQAQSRRTMELHADRNESRHHWWDGREESRRLIAVADEKNGDESSG